MANEQKPIFLSHSYHDKDLAERLVNLLTNGCDVSRNDIFCSSLNGMNIKVGTTSFIKYLKEQLEAPKFVILLVTENYLASSFCLAELGAAWRIGAPFFPLAVPPISRSDIGGVLELVQAGDITKPAYLDQLRDKIIELFQKQMSTDGWNDQKDIFLNGLDALIKGIKKPDLVKREELDTAQDKSKRLLDLITAKDGEVGTLKEQIEELKKLKDKEQVAEFVRKHSSSDEEYERLRSLAAKALSKLKSATCAALFWDIRGNGYQPDTSDEWDNVHAAEADKEIYGDGVYRPNSDLLIVGKAENAVRDLKNFLRDLKDADFFMRFEEEHEYPADIGVQKFWENQLNGF
jgi:hypothetical protein